MTSDRGPSLRPSIREGGRLGARGAGAGAGSVLGRAAAAPPRSSRPSGRSGPRVIAIGASTGGVEALMEVLSAFPASCPPTVVVQHMKGRFIGGFVSRLDRACRPSVREATPDAPLRAGTVHVATGDETHLHVEGSTAPRCALRPGGLVSGHRPSVDAMFHSLVPIAPRVVAVLLTGMGRDGAEGMLALRRGGARTICQDGETCVVHGMPRAAADLGAAEVELPLDRIARAILKAARQAVA